MTKEKKAEYDARFHQKHKEERNQVSRQYYQDNVEKEKLKRKEWYERNRDEVCKKAATYREQNKERVNANQRAYYQKHREEERIKAKARLAALPYSAKRLKILNKHHLSQELYDKMYMDQLGLCAICHEPFGNETPTIDHNHHCCLDKHSCGKCVRGLVHARHNAAIGFFNDNVNTVVNAAIYLAKALDNKEMIRALEAVPVHQYE